MVTRTHGFRVGTRKKMTKATRDKGKVRIRSVLQEFKPEETVLIKVDSAYHKGLPHKRFFGKQGKVIEKRGKAYVVKLKDGGKEKHIICAPIHLRKC
jgi:large subunit ribosomal protein L21e